MLLPQIAYSVFINRRELCCLLRAHPTKEFTNSGLSWDEAYTGYCPHPQRKVFIQLHMLLLQRKHCSLHYLKTLSYSMFKQSRFAFYERCNYISFSGRNLNFKHAGRMLRIRLFSLSLEFIVSRGGKCLSWGQTLLLPIWLSKFLLISLGLF